LARHEGDFRANAQEPLSLADLIALLASDSAAGVRSRQRAIACYLSGGDGWRDALKELGGAFAENDAKLRDRKTD